jgi:hypothetical protein
MGEWEKISVVGWKTVPVLTAGFSILNDAIFLMGS